MVAISDTLAVFRDVPVRLRGDRSQGTLMPHAWGVGGRDDAV